MYNALGPAVVLFIRLVLSCASGGLVQVGNMCAYTDMHIYTQIHIYIYIRMSIYVYPTYVCTYILPNMHAHIHTYIQICTLPNHWSVNIIL